MILKDYAKELKKMTIKMIAVDMDGTFLDDHKKYNQARFNRLFHQMQEQNIHFVVASGNQYSQLKSFFPKHHQEISFIAENGALVVEKGEEIFSESIPIDLVRHSLELLGSLPDVAVIVCGKKSAYILDTSDEQFISIVRMFYHKLELVPNFAEVEDHILKVTLGFEDSKTTELQQYFGRELEPGMTPVSSGRGTLDLIRTGTHKASGLKKLIKEGTIQAQELMVFGDGGNDIEMLQLAKYSFAMENASDEIKKVAAYVAPSNNEEGVFEVMEHYLVHGDVEQLEK